MGRPLLRQFDALIAELGGDDVILDRIADGDFVSEVARSYGVSRRTIYDWRDMNEQRRSAWEAARKLSAGAKVERAHWKYQELESNPRLTSAQAKIGTDYAKLLQWEASKLDREQYGDTPAVQVNNLTLGEAHLEALLIHGRPQDAQVIEADVIEELPPAPEQDEAA